LIKRHYEATIPDKLAKLRTLKDMNYQKQQQLSKQKNTLSNIQTLRRVTIDYIICFCENIKTLFEEGQYSLRDTEQFGQTTKEEFEVTGHNQFLCWFLLI
jgi:hypothetical protein